MDSAQEPRSKVQVVASVLRTCLNASQPVDDATLLGSWKAGTQFGMLDFGATGTPGGYLAVFPYRSAPVTPELVNRMCDNYSDLMETFCHDAGGTADVKGALEAACELFISIPPPYGPALAASCEFVNVFYAYGCFAQSSCDAFKNVLDLAYPPNQPITISVSAIKANFRASARRTYPPIPSGDAQSLVALDPLTLYGDPTSPSSLVLSRASAVMHIGGNLVLTALPLDAESNPYTCVAVDWQTSNAAVATVSVLDAAGESATIHAQSIGSVVITATSGNAKGSALINVDPEVTSVGVSADSVFMTVGDSKSLSAVAKDASGNPVPNAKIHFTSSAPSIVAIDSSLAPSVTLHGVSRGSARISASCGGVSSSVGVQVADPLNMIGTWTAFATAAGPLPAQECSPFDSSEGIVCKGWAVFGSDNTVTSEVSAYDPGSDPSTCAVKVRYPPGTRYTLVDYGWNGYYVNKKLVMDFPNGYHDEYIIDNVDNIWRYRWKAGPGDYCGVLFAAPRPPSLARRLPSARALPTHPGRR
jgi:hypothetical protein